MKLAKGEKIGSSAEEGYIPNGVRVNFFEKERGSKRAVKMLIKKLNDKPYVTEYPMPNFDRVEPNPAVKDLAHAKIALVTSGGIVPKGNPDHIESSVLLTMESMILQELQILQKRHMRLHMADMIRYMRMKIRIVYFR